MHLWTRDTTTAGVKVSFHLLSRAKGNTHHVQVMDSHKKYFSLEKSTSINKRVDIT